MKIIKQNAELICLSIATLMAASSINAFFDLGIFSDHRVVIAVVINVIGLILARFIAPILGQKFIGVRDHETERYRSEED